MNGPAPKPTRGRVVVLVFVGAVLLLIGGAVWLAATQLSPRDQETPRPRPEAPRGSPR